MIYRAVKELCAFDFGCLDNQCSRSEAYRSLNRYDIGPVRDIPRDLIAMAGTAAGKSRYSRGAPMGSAPDIFDCSSFTKWCYANVGIWLPRLAVQQFECGQPVSLDHLIPGDLVFFTGPVNCWDKSPKNAVGHVALYTGDGYVIHATRVQGCVVEAPLAGLVRRRRNTRGARRVIANPADTVVLRCPPGLDIETSDDVRWLVLRSLAKGGSTEEVP